MRTKHDPLKWPILDNKGGENEEFSALHHLVPPPPLPKTFRDTHSDNLNPNVAEFIPNESTPGGNNVEGTMLII